MIRSIRFTREYRMFQAGTEFHFLTDVPNLLVGDQGTGKSTLLEILGSPDRFTKYAEIDIDAGEVLQLSAEFDNPRTKDPAESATSRLEAGMESFGEVMRRQIESLKTERSVVWLLDEPDTSLSIRSCFLLVKAMHTAVMQGSQVIAAVHSPIVMRGVRQVLSLEHRKWVYPSDFIEQHTPVSVHRSSGRIPRPRVRP